MKIIFPERFKFFFATKKGTGFQVLFDFQIMILGNDLVIGGAVIGLGIYGRHSEALSGLTDLGNVKMRDSLFYHRVCPFVYVI